MQYKTLRVAGAESRKAMRPLEISLAWKNGESILYCAAAAFLKQSFAAQYALGRTNFFTDIKRGTT